MNITNEYVFISTKLDEIKYDIEKIVIVIGKGWIINIIFTFLIK